jgi:hypothetical protein
MFAFLKLPNHPSKHRNDYVGWEIAECLHHVVLIATNFGFTFFTFSVNEITAIDNQS